MATPQVRLDFTVSKSPLVPFNSTICPRNGPKRRQKAPKSAQCAPTPRNQERAVSWATWLKAEFRGHLVHPQPPTFCGFQASESPNQTPRHPVPVVTWWSRRAARPAHGGGQRWVHRGPRGEKNDFFQSCSHTTLHAETHVFRPFLSPWCRVLGHGKSQNALKMGHFKTKNGSKMGRKRVFPKVILDHLGCSNRCF